MGKNKDSGIVDQIEEGEVDFKEIYNLCRPQAGKWLYSETADRAGKFKNLSEMTKREIRWRLKKCRYTMSDKVRKTFQLKLDSTEEEWERIMVMVGLAS
jgi:hypothetical protein